MTDEQKQAIISQHLSDNSKREEAPFATIGPLGNIRYNFGRIGRAMMVVDPLPQGALPIYSHDPDIVMTISGADVASDDSSE